MPVPPNVATTSGDSRRIRNEFTRSTIFGTSDRAFRSFCVFLVREVAGRVLVREQDGDVVAGEVRGFELTDNLIGLSARGGDAEYRFL